MASTSASANRCSWASATRSAVPISRMRVTLRHINHLIKKSIQYLAVGELLYALPTTALYHRTSLVGVDVIFVAVMLFVVFGVQRLQTLSADVWLGLRLCPTPRVVAPLQIRAFLHAGIVLLGQFRTGAPNHPAARARYPWSASCSLKLVNNASTSQHLSASLNSQTVSNWVRHF